MIRSHPPPNSAVGGKGVSRPADLTETQVLHRCHGAVGVLSPSKGERLAEPRVVTHHDLGRRAARTQTGEEPVLPIPRIFAGRTAQS